MRIKVVVEAGELEDLNMDAENLEWEIAELIQNKHDISLTVEVIEDED